MPQVNAILVMPIICLLSVTAYADAANECTTDTGVLIQILGSGGPIADDARSSSSYLVWIDGKSKILVDVGGGASLRFGQSGARFEDLDHIAISHFHTDHSADLVTLLKSGYFTNRERDLSISGPDAGGPFPSLSKYLNQTIGNDGTYAYLSGYIDGTNGLARLQPMTLSATSRETMPVIGNEKSRIQIEAIGVRHGIVPALAYRIRVGNKIIVFSGDQNGDDEEFIEFARDADVLVMHMPVPENIAGAGRRLHAPPSRIGQIAKVAKAPLLVLSHFMARSLRNIDENVANVRRHYGGKTILANDLQCIRISD